MDNYGIRTEVIRNGQRITRKNRRFELLQDALTIVIMFGCIGLLLFL